AHHHELVLEGGVAAFQDADDVFGVALFSVDGHVDVELFDGIESERIQLGVGAGIVKDLRAVDALALEERVGEFQAGGHGRHGGTGRRLDELNGREGRAVKSGAATTSAAG